MTEKIIRKQDLKFLLYGVFDESSETKVGVK
jgi:hypothetical protein